MMIGKTEGTSASFVDYQVRVRADRDGQDKGNVSAAVRGKTIGERNREALDEAQKNLAETEAYQVNISGRAKDWNTFVSGATARISPSGGVKWSREEELSALEETVRDYQKMNENYRLTGSPVGPQEAQEREQERMEAVVAQFSQEALNRLQTAEKNGIAPVKQDFSDVLKTSTGFENDPVAKAGDPFVAKAVYTPVTEVRTRHYRWTEETGIEETVTKEQEIAAYQEVLRKNIADDIKRTVDEILKPYETYEEAYDKLYGEKGVSLWTELNEDTMTFDMTVRNAQGAFGAFANHLNNYLEQFGSEDPFLGNLAGALEELAANGDNDLVDQMRKMVEKVRNGEHIDTESEEFQEEVEEAISDAYGNTTKKKKDEVRKKEEQGPEQEQGLSFLDMQRRAAEQEGRLLDELLGKEHETGFESAGDVLAKRAPEGKDTEFADRLRHIDERKEPEKPFTFDTGETSAGTERSKDEIAQQQAVYDAWTKIGEKLLSWLPTGHQKFLEE